MIVISGDAQTAVVGKVLPNPVVVRVVDSASVGLSGQLVNFRVSSGSLTGGVVTTDAEGLAREIWTLGNTAGIQRLEIGIVDKLTNLPLALTGNAQASALADAPAQLTKVSGDGLSMPPGVRDTLVVRVSDRFGNPVSNVAVDWNAAQTSGTLSVTRSMSDALGLARTLWTPGTQPGPATVGASIGNVTTIFGLMIRSVVANLSISPPSIDMTPGSTVQLTATPQDATGNTLSGQRVAWSSSNGTAATVDSTGTVHALAVGTTTITATAGDKSATATIRVLTQPAAIATVSLAPANPALSIGTSTRLTATARDSNGAELTGRSFTWITTSPDIATVDQSGLVIGVDLGTATVSATSEGKTGTTQVTVTSAPSPSNIARVEVTPSAPVIGPGATVQLSPIARDAQGATLAGKTFTWSTSNPSVATVTQSGLVTALASGTAQISATSEGYSGSALVSVVLLMKVSGDGQTGVISRPLTDSLVVKAFNSSLQPAAGITINWAVTGGGGSVSPASAVTDANGVARAEWTLGSTPGLYFVNATISGIGTVSFHATANLAAVASVTVTPGSATVNLQNTTAFTAQIRDDQGNVLTGRRVVWSSIDPAVAVVDSSLGVARGVNEGSTTIVATSEGKSGSATLTVNRVPASISRTDNAIKVPVGSIVTATVIVRDGNFAPMASVPVRFAIVGAGGSVTPDSVLTNASGNASTSWTLGTTPGVYRLSASAGPSIILTDTATLGPVAIIEVTPNSYSFSTLSCQHMFVTGRDIYGNALDLALGTLAQPQYTVLDQTTAYVNPSGNRLGASQNFRYLPTVCPLAHNGSTKVIVATGGKADTADITVQIIPAEVRVTGGTSIIQPDSTTRFVATPYVFGNAMTGEAVAWTSSNPAVATVDSTGFIRGISTGIATIRATILGVAGEKGLLVSYPPVLTATTVTNLTSTSATLNGTVDTGNLNVNGNFNYDVDPAVVYPFTGSVSLQINASTSVTPVSINATGLTPNTTYYFKITASNPAGSGTSNIASFTTPP